jgi:ABC-type nitrate/sulfonate/bicarbonate transport system substrate-binding protein
MPAVIDLTVGATSSSSSAISFIYSSILSQMPQFYRQVGLKVNALTVAMGQSVQLIQSGSPPVVLGVGVGTLLAGQDHGVNQVKFFAGELQKPAYELVARPGITSMKQIKTLGVPSVESGASEYCQDMLATQGLKVNRDYSLVLVGTSGARIAAVQAGKVDGSCELTPYPQLYHDKYNMPILARAADLLPYSATGNWAYNTTWAKTPLHHEALVRLAEANLLATRWAFDPANKARVEAIAAKTLHVPAKYADLFYQQEIGEQLATPDGYIPRQALQSDARDLVSMGLSKTTPNLEKDYNWSFLQEAAKRLHVTIRPIGS